ncbi:hypothetical protein X726_32330 [Mesorhizobium sp. L103C105A0]|nr:hypothetical protein X726_32330 [Mesorhizobium sp. L103C105A0]
MTPAAFDLVKVTRGVGRNRVSNVDASVLISVMTPHQRTVGTFAQRDNSFVIALLPFDILPQKVLQRIPYVVLEVVAW